MAETANKHITHLEDAWIDRGYQGLKDSIKALEGAEEVLKGTVDKPRFNITTKWDGAPAIITGTNPDNGKFFVATKGAFAQTPKLMYTPEDIKRTYGAQEGLAQKLLIALKYFKDLRIPNVIQGDIMYTYDSLKITTINGEKYVVFQPNTITYAIPYESDLAKTILQSKIGVVWHTEYNGISFDKLAATYSNNIADRLAPSKDVWYRNATFHDVSGVATFTEKEFESYKALLAAAYGLILNVKASDVNRISTQAYLKDNISAFINANIREGELLSSYIPSRIASMKKVIQDKYNQNILDAKRDDTKQKRTIERRNVLQALDQLTPTFITLFQIRDYFIQAKMMILKKLQQVKEIGTFFKDAKGYKVTTPEGFVVVDTIHGNVLKLVDRLDFSRTNFNAIKDWK